MPDWGQLLTSSSPILVALVGGAAMVFVPRVWKPGEREVVLIGEYRKDREADREEIAELKQQLGELEEKVRRLLSRDILWERHAYRLEDQIIDLGHVPHPRPAALMPTGETPTVEPPKEGEDG